MKRVPAVAGQFYPGTPEALEQTLDSLIPAVDEKEKKEALAVISPHAGYMYSGGVAGETFAGVKVPEDVIILGPNHTGHGAPVALMAEGTWQMPMGEVTVNTALAAEIERASGLVTRDATAHRFEHSLEVQVPFLQYRRQRLGIAPLVISRLSYEDCLDLGRSLAEAVRKHGRPVLLVASTDMTHYESRDAAGRKDRMALESILRLDPEGLYRTVVENRITMCGIMPTTVTLVAAIHLGARKAELVRYSDSGEASGDTRQVVGYAGLVII